MITLFSLESLLWEACLILLEKFLPLFARFYTSQVVVAHPPKTFEV